MMMKSVYLAGPISGLTFDGAHKGWREKASQWFEADGVRALSPLRGKEFLRNRGVISKAYEDHPLSTAKGIVRRDYNDLCQCDAVLACFLDETAVSIGTCWEFGAAYALGKPVIAVLPPNSKHSHPFITETAAYVFDDLIEAIVATQHLLGI